MKLIFYIFLYFSIISLYANDNNKTLQTLVQELTVQNENLKKDLEITNKKFELLESKITYKSDSLDNLAKQMEANEKNFDKTFNLYFWMLCVGFGMLVLFGIYKGYKIWKIKDELDEYKKYTFDPIADSLKVAQSILTLNTETLGNKIQDYENNISRLYHQADRDKSEIQTTLEELITNLDIRVLQIEKLCCKEDSLSNIDITNEAKQNSKDNAKNLTDDLLE